MLIALGAVVLSGCGADDGVRGDAAGQLDGHEFLSQSVDGRSLVAGTQIRLAFDDGRLSANAGCNSLGAPYEVVDGHLVTADGAMSMTEMGCDPPRHAQDEWLAELLQAEPNVAVDGDALTLTAGDTVVHLVDRVVADPDRPLVGTRWQVDTVIRGDAASSVPSEDPVVLELGDGHLDATSAGCTSVRIEVEIDSGQHSLRFGDVVVDSIGCPSPWEDVVELLRTGSARYTISAARLTLTAGDLGVSAVTG